MADVEKQAENKTATKKNRHVANAKTNSPHKEKTYFPALPVEQKILVVLVVVCCTISQQALSIAEPQTQLNALSAGR
jgi:hypothetical protein